MHGFYQIPAWCIISKEVGRIVHFLHTLSTGMFISCVCVLQSGIVLSYLKVNMAIFNGDVPVQHAHDRPLILPSWYAMNIEFINQKCQLIEISIKQNRTNLLELSASLLAGRAAVSPTTPRS